LTGKSIVVLALSKEDTPDQTKSHYPNGANYKFDAEAPRMELRGLNVFADEAIEDLFALLRRGGKAVLAKGDISVVAEIDEEGSCVLHKKIRVPTEKK
jgi:hypothetical protein